MDNLREVEEFEEVILHFRNVPDRSNPLESMDDVKFLEKFRFSKDNVRFLFEIIEPSIPYIVRKSTVPPILQLLTTLRFYATGSFQEVVGELLVISQPTVSRLVKRVSVAIAARQAEFIQFPGGQEGVFNQRKFKQSGGVPGVVGCIDCTHIKIRSPGGPNAELYRNRKGWFSINVQAVCDAKLKFTNIIARWPGSVHDSRIFNSSRLCGQFENNDIGGILLGDSGYALKPYLLTPVSNPQTAAERRYNFGHARTRNSVERVFGIWKRRFACLSTGLRVKEDTTLIIIVATAILHNLARTFNVEDIHDDDIVTDDDDDSDDNNQGQGINRRPNRLGVAIRNTIIQQNFT